MEAEAQTNQTVPLGGSSFNEGGSPN
jgi:hypothetical protein